MKKINPAVIVPLKNALSNLYWFKSDLISFMNGCVSDEHIFLVRDLDSSKIKYQICSDFINRMFAREDLFQKEILRTIKAVCDINSFDHFNTLDNSKELKRKAQEYVEILRKQAYLYVNQEDRNELNELTRKAIDKKNKENSDFRNKVFEMKEKYINLSKLENTQKRGYEFEKWLNELFMLFDIESKGSFRINGEQIDGAITLDGIEFLLEAKWQREPISKSEIYIFMGKINNKLKNTLGIYISVNGYSQREYSSSDISSVILFDSIDLIQVLDCRVDLKFLIRRKKQEASRTGNILYRIED